MSTRDILIDAKTLLLDSTRWVQGSRLGACDADGLDTLSTDRTAVRWNLIGSIIKTANGSDYGLAQAEIEKYTDGLFVSRYNDLHSHSEILALLDRAIKTATVKR